MQTQFLLAQVPAATRDGEIRVSTSAAVDARSEGGAVTVSMGSDGSGPRRVESERGAVWVGLPRDADLRLQVDAGGELASEVELQAAPSPIGRQRGTAVLGKGSQPVVIATGSGRVEIVRAR